MDGNVQNFNVAPGAGLVGININQQIGVNGIPPDLEISNSVIRSDVSQQAGSVALNYIHADSNTNFPLTVKLTNNTFAGAHPFPTDVIGNAYSAGGGRMSATYENNWFESCAVTSTGFTPTWSGNYCGTSKSTRFPIGSAIGGQVSLTLTASGPFENLNIGNASIVLISGPTSSFSIAGMMGCSSGD
jgi:hypothetical protein